MYFGGLLSHRESYPAFQKKCAFTSHRDLNGAPGPVGHPANGEQINTLAPQYLEGPWMVYGPAQRQQEGAQSQPFQELHHQQMSQTGLASTGFQQPHFWDSGCRRLNNGYHPRKHANAYFDSSPGLNLNKKTNRRQRPHLNGAFSTGTSSVCNALGFSSERHWESWEVRSSLLDVYCGQTVTQPPLPAGEMKPPTDDEIQNYIQEKIKYFTTASSREGGKDGHTPQSVYNRPGSSADHCHHGTAGSDKPERPDVCYAEQHTAEAAGALQVISPKASSKETSDHSTQTSVSSSSKLPHSLTLEKELVSGLEKRKSLSETDNLSKPATHRFWNKESRNINLCTATEYPLSVARVAATCTKSEDKSAAILSESGLSLDLLGEMEPFLPLNCSMPQQGQALGFNSKGSNEKEKEDGGLNPIEAAGSAHTQSSVVNRNKGFVLVSPNGDQDNDTNKKENNSHEGSKDAGPVCPQTELSENKIQKLDFLFLKDPKYEDISDDDTWQLLTNLPNTEQEGLRATPHLSNDDDPQVVPEPDYPQAPSVPPRNEGYGCVRSQVPLDMESSQEKVMGEKWGSPKTGTPDTTQQCPSLDEADDLLCPKSDSDRLGYNPIHPDLFSSSSVFQGGDETDDDDDFIVIPISISGIEFEPKGEALGVPETVVPGDNENGAKDLHGDTSAKHPELHYIQEPEASVICELEEYATIQSFLRTKALECGACFVLSSPERELEPEAEDSCDTEDSCDYSSTLGPNHMTVSPHLLKSAAPLPAETNHSSPAMNVQKARTKRLKLGSLQKLKELMEAKAEPKHIQPKTDIQKISKRDEAIIICDSEDECDQNCKVQVKAKRRLKKKRPALECQPKVEHDDDDDMTETRGHLIEIKAHSEHVQHETKTKREDTITFGSGTNDSDHNYKQASRKSSGFVDSRRAPCIQPKRPFPQNVDAESGTRRLSSTNSSVPRPQSKAHGARFKAVSQDTTADLPPATKKSGHGNEARCGSEHGWKRVLQDSERVVKKDQQSSKNRGMMERFSSVSKWSHEAFFLRQKRQKMKSASEDVERFCGPADKMAHRPVLSSEALRKRQSQSVDKEADSSSSSSKLLTKVHRRSRDEPLSPGTAAATSKKTDWCDKNMHHQPGFVPRPTQKVEACVLKATPPTGQLPSFTNTLPSAGVQLPKARPSSELSQSGETTSFSVSVPWQGVPPSKLKRCLSHGNPGALDTPGPTTEGRTLFEPMQLSARERLRREFNSTHVPTRKDRRHSMRTANNDSRREERRVPSHSRRATTQKNVSQRAAMLPLLKRSQNEAIEMTLARNKDPATERYMMSQSYQWSEKSRATNTSKAPSPTFPFLFSPDHRTRKRMHPSPLRPHR